MVTSLVDRINDVIKDIDDVVTYTSKSGVLESLSNIIKTCAESYNHVKTSIKTEEKKSNVNEIAEGLMKYKKYF